MSKIKFFLLREVASTLHRVGWVCDSLELQRTEALVWKAYSKVFNALKSDLKRDKFRDDSLNKSDEEYPPKLQ